MDDLRGRFAVRRNDYALPPKKPAAATSEVVEQLKPVYLTQPTTITQPAPISKPVSIPVRTVTQAPTEPITQAAPQADQFASELIEDDAYFEPATEATTNEVIPLLPEEDEGGHTPAIQTPVQLYQPRVATAEKSRKLVLLSSAATVAVAGIIIASGWLYFFKGSATPLPSAVTSALGFEAYFPEQLPDGYVYQLGSASGSTAGLQYRLAKGGQVITVIEQPLKGAASLGQLPDSSLLTLPQGNARVEVNSNNQPEGVLVTKKLEINVLGNGSVNMPDITTVIQNLAPNSTK